MEIKQIGNLLEDTENFHNRTTGRVYDKDGLCPTISCMGGGNRQPMIVDDIYNNRKERIYNETAPTLRSERIGLKCIVAMRGRNPENPTSRVAGLPTEQRLEPNLKGVSNTLTSVQKDNLVLEGISTKGKVIDTASTILAGYERTNMTGFNADNGVLEFVNIKQATKDGYIRCKVGGIADLSYPNSKTRRGESTDGG